MHIEVLSVSNSSLCSVLLEDPALKNRSKKKNSNSKKKNYTKRKTEKGKKEKDLSLDYYKYFAGCIGFGIVGKVLRKSLYAQSIFTIVFYIYVYWFSSRFDRLKKEDFGF